MISQIFAQFPLQVASVAAMIGGVLPTQIPPLQYDLRLEELPEEAEEPDIRLPQDGAVDLAVHYRLEFPVPTPAPRVYPVVAQAQVVRPVLAPHELDGLFDRYGEQFGVEPELLKRIAKCESGYRADAVNGPYLGMYQYLASTWSSTRNAMGMDPDPVLRTDAEQSILTTAWKIAAGGRGAWPSCGR